MIIFSCEEITDKRIRAIGNALATNLTHLKKLHFGFQGCNKITDQGLDKFSLSIGESVLDLEKLILDFS